MSDENSVMTGEGKVEEVGLRLLGCAGKGDAAGVRLVLEEGIVEASYQCEASGVSALMEAAKAGSVETVELLLERGAPWNALDRGGRCAGEYAYDAGSQACVDALVDAGVRAQLLFGSLEDSRSEVVPKKFLPPESTEYLGGGVHFEEGDDVLVDAAGDAVMMDWERPLMEAHADVLTGSFPQEWCLPLAQMELSVLNVGHGTGVVDGFIRDRRPKSHTIVEAHPAVLRRMREKGGFESATLKPVKWQTAIADPTFGPFDAIFFDTYAESYADMKHFFETLPRILKKPHGIFSFFNGMCPFNVFFHGVACQLVKVELQHIGLDIDYVPLKVDDLPETTWQHGRRPYWTFDTYHLPIARWKQQPQ